MFKVALEERMRRLRVAEIPGCGGAKFGGAEAELGLLAQDEGLSIAGWGGRARLGRAV